MKWYFVALIAVAALLIGMWIGKKQKTAGTTTMTLVPNTGSNSSTPAATTTTTVAA